MAVPGTVPLSAYLSQRQQSPLPMSPPTSPDGAWSLAQSPPPPAPNRVPLRDYLSASSPSQPASQPPTASRRLAPSPSFFAPPTAPSPPAEVTALKAGREALGIGQDVAKGVGDPSLAGHLSAATNLISLPLALMGNAPDPIKGVSVAGSVGGLARYAGQSPSLVGAAAPYLRLGGTALGGLASAASIPMTLMSDQPNAIKGFETAKSVLNLYETGKVISNLFSAPPAATAQALQAATKGAEAAGIGGEAASQALSRAANTAASVATQGLPAGVTPEAVEAIVQGLEAGGLFGEEAAQIAAEIAKEGVEGAAVTAGSATAKMVGSIVKVAGPALSLGMGAYQLAEGETVGGALNVAGAVVSLAMLSSGVLAPFAWIPLVLGGAGSFASGLLGGPSEWEQAHEIDPMGFRLKGEQAFRDAKGAPPPPIGLSPREEFIRKWAWNYGWNYGNLNASDRALLTGMADRAGLPPTPEAPPNRQAYVNAYADQFSREQGLGPIAGVSPEDHARLYALAEARTGWAGQLLSPTFDEAGVLSYA